MMGWLDLVLAVACVLAGGYGGYKVGRAIEKKAKAVIEAVKKAG